MIDLEKICEELNLALPQAGWPLRRKLRSFMPRSGSRYAAEVWTSASAEKSVGLKIYEREKSPVLIVFETDSAVGTAEPFDFTAENIVRALNEFRWIVGG